MCYVADWAAGPLRLGITLSLSQLLSLQFILTLPSPRPFSTSVKCYLDKEWSKMDKQREKKMQCWF